jgi:hypothetical protein
MWWKLRDYCSSGSPNHSPIVPYAAFPPAKSWRASFRFVPHPTRGISQPKPHLLVYIHLPKLSSAQLSSETSKQSRAQAEQQARGREIDQPKSESEERRGRASALPFCRFGSASTRPPPPRRAAATTAARRRDGRPREEQLFGRGCRAQHQR